MAEAKSMYDQLEKLDGKLPKGWKPESGEMIAGKVLRYDQSTSKFGLTLICVIEEEKTKEQVSIWAGNVSLMREFVRFQPKPGEIIGIKYFGKAENTNFHAYKMLMNRRDGTVAEGVVWEDINKALAEKRKDKNVEASGAIAQQMAGGDIPHPGDAGGQDDIEGLPF